MEEIVNQLVNWILSLSPLYVYLIFGFIAYLENIVPPIPGDLLVAFGGYLAAEQMVGFTPLLAITTVASVIGFMNMYWFGAYFGHKIDEHRERFWLMQLIDVKYFDKVERWMNRWGQGVILANRFLAGTRSVISVTAGVSRTRVSYTVLSSTISSLSWNAILLGLGWFVHENWQVIGDYLNIYGRTTIVVIFIAVTAYILYKRSKKKRKEKTEKISSKRVD
jgi:membrane protein DedA with SNARE-associated domain